MIKDLTLWQGLGETVLIHSWRKPEPLRLALRGKRSITELPRQTWGRRNQKTQRSVCAGMNIPCKARKPTYQSNKEYAIFRDTGIIFKLSGGFLLKSKTDGRKLLWSWVP